jgi:hypothetical protein
MNSSLKRCFENFHFKDGRVIAIVLKKSEKSRMPLVIDKWNFVFKGTKVNLLYKKFMKGQKSLSTIV